MRHKVSPSGAIKVSEEERVTVGEFDKRRNRSVRCKESVWAITREASAIAACSTSVFAETALLLLARLVKDEGLRLTDYDVIDRWLHEKIQREGSESVLVWLTGKKLISD
jgi:hypothetical protein